MWPFYEAMSLKYKDLAFMKIDVDEAEEITSSCGVNKMPTFQMYKSGIKIDELVGASKVRLEEMIVKNLPLLIKT